jgi:hypothetical protein
MQLALPAPLVAPRPAYCRLMDFPQQEGAASKGPDDVVFPQEPHL